MKKLLLFFAVMLSVSTLLAQTTTLTFTGRDANNHFIPLNRVVITNLTKGWQETIYYPDTILVMSSVGIEDYGKVEGFNLSQNSPNPFDGTSDFSLCLPKDGQVSIEVYDLNGKKITSYNNTLTAGCHVFRVLLSTAQSYFLTARSGNDQASIKMINTGNAGSNALLYIGEGNMQPLSVKLDNNSKGQTEHPFSIGDNMEYVGYAVVNGEEYESQHIQQTQNGSENFILNFDCVANPNVSLQSLTVTNVMASSATLSANVTSSTDGQQLQRGFQYDTDAAFANAINVACGTGNGTFSTNITGLQDATLYYVRAFATYHTTTTYSDAETFTTLCNPLNISISGNSSICNGNSTTLTATGADTYQWFPAAGLNVQTGSTVVASPAESTVYTVTGTAANGCTGTANVSVVVNQTYNIGTTAEICPGESFNFFGQTLTAAGTYNHTLQTEQGCDSVITLTLSLKEVPNINVSGNTTICQGSSTVLTATGASTYLWTPATGLSTSTSDVVTANPSTSTSYSVAGTAVNGCTATANVSVIVNPTYNFSTTAEICSGESYNFFGQVLTVAGTYTHTLQSVQGCDSVITLTLSLKEVPNVTISGNTTICQGTSTVLTATGASTYLWTPATGLSSTTSDVVTAIPSTSTSYSVTGTATNGCTATANVSVIVNPTYNVSTTAEICSGESYNFFGQTLTAAGTYNHTLQSVQGCDSVITLTLSLKEVPNINVSGNTTICQGASTVLTATGAATYLWTPATGLSSTTSDVVTANPSSSISYSVTGTAANGCTATANVSVIVNPTYNYSTTAEICPGESFNFFGQTLTAAGTYTHTLQSVQGCDSVITLTLSLKEVPNVTISGNTTICQGTSTILTATGASTYLWTPATDLSSTTSDMVTANPSTSTSYSVAGTAANGCTGYANVLVTVLPTADTTINASICEGAQYPFFGQQLTASGTYYHTLQTVQGCDSIITLVLTVNNLPTISITGNISICNGGFTTLTANGAVTYQWMPATGLNVQIGATVIAMPTSSITYTILGTDANGCTNSGAVTVTVNPVFNTALNAEICQGEVYLFFGQNLTTSGTYTHTLQSIHGCDSVITLSLTVKTLPNVNVVGNTDICLSGSTILAANGAIAYQWSPATGLNTTTGNIVTASPATSTQYTVIGTAANGCTNTVNVLVSVHETYTNTIADNFCQGTSYNFYGQQLTQGGVYTHTLQSIYGCDSVITLILTQKNAPSVSITGERSICQNGNSILTANGANTYQWLPAEGMSTTSGPAVVVTPSVSTNYTVVGTAANGCTGSASAFVEVYPVYQTNISQSICQGQSYNFYGQILTSAGVYNHTLQTAHGCDSVITLTLFIQQLTINGISEICENGSTTLTVTGVNNALWTPSTGLSSATGNTVIASPSSTTTYNVSGSSSSGCSLSTTVTITVYPKYQINRTAEICQGQTYSFYGQQLSSSGTYSHTLQSVYGCDSVISLQLTVHPLPSVNISGDNAICEGDTASLTANGANTYQWSPATGLSATTGNSVSAYPAESVIYTVNGTDTNGCVGSATHLLVVDELPNISITGNTTVNYGSSTTLTATGASTYQWNTGATGNTLTVLPQSSTNYSVTGTNTAGCSSTQSIAVTVNPVAPSVSTQSATNVSDSSALVSGTLISHGGVANVSVGFQYATNNSFSDASTIAASVNNFNCTISGLDMSTTYSVRAYATNSVGTTYGNTVSFTTLTCNLASVTTNAIDTTLMTKVSVTVSGSVTNSGGCQVTSKGFCWSTNPYPAITDNVLTVDTNSNNFTAVLTGLQPLTTYYLRSFAVTHAGVAYGNRVQFKTLSANLAELTTTDVSNVQAYSATSGGRVISAGHPVTARGVCWSTAHAPSISDAHTTDGSGVGSFTSSITGLTDGTTYYVRAYATIDEGTAYGNEYTFTTLSLPVLTTNTPSNVTSNTVTLGGNVSNQGANEVTERGVCYSITANPTIDGNHKIVGSGVGDFSCNLTGLNSGTTYYVRAYATNGRGTAYGEQKTYTTASFTCGSSTIADADNNIYQTVLINNQCWMKQNLRTTHYSSGTAIALGSDTSSSIGYYYYPNDDNTIVNTYGLLYNWTAVMNGAISGNALPSGVQGICPIGWHLPSDAEWGVLTANVGNQLSFLCNENSLFIAKALASTSGWNNSSVTCAVGNAPSSNNATGFAAMPSGDYGTTHENFGKFAYFWTSTSFADDNSNCRKIGTNSPIVASENIPRQYGMSVRCVRDLTGLPSVVTKSVTNIINGTATCGGFVESQGNSPITAHGICWSTSPNPTLADNHTTDGTGAGSYTSNITVLVSATYYVRAYATNSVGTVYGNMQTFVMPLDGEPCPNAATLTDVDGHVYNTVQIGKQCWMKENLRTTKYADGTNISSGSSTSTSTTTAYRYNPDNSSSTIYGYLYNWPAVMHNSTNSGGNPSRVQGICPNGWHVPSNAEWTQLTDYVKSQSEYVCGDDSYCIAKALASDIGWTSSTYTCAVGNNPSTNNATGFSAVPAGGYGGSYVYFGYNAYFWSTTLYDFSSPYYCDLQYSSAGVLSRNGYGKYYGFSVRCVRDDERPDVYTSLVANITQTSATCNGYVISDGGATVTARGVCWSTSPNPTISDSHTTDGTGTGSFTSNLTGLTTSTLYYVCAYATNNAGTAYGEQVVFRASAQPCRGAATLTDVDGNVYNTVMIGQQCWMKENLRTTHYADGTSISLGSSASTTTAYRYYPGDRSERVSTHGYLYNWKAVMRNSSSSSNNPSWVQGICPDGWHVPSDAEWTELTNYVKNQSEYACGYCSTCIAKALASSTGWGSSTNTCAVSNISGRNNATGFSAVPAGYHNGSSSSFGDAYFWSATQNSDYAAYFRRLYSYGAEVTRDYDPKYIGFSVRCVKD